MYEGKSESRWGPVPVHVPINAAGSWSTNDVMVYLALS